MVSPHVETLEVEYQVPPQCPCQAYRYQQKECWSIRKKEIAIQNQKNLSVHLSE